MRVVAMRAVWLYLVDIVNKVSVQYMQPIVDHNQMLWGSLCSSRKYPYSPHGWFFVLYPLMPPPPPPQEIPVYSVASYFSSNNLGLKTPLLKFPITFHGGSMNTFWNHTFFYPLVIGDSYFFFRKHTRSSTSNAEIGNIENEYIRNLQQQIYFLELEANYLYPFRLLMTWLNNNLITL